MNYPRLSSVADTARAWFATRRQLNRRYRQALARLRTLEDRLAREQAANERLSVERTGLAADIVEERSEQSELKSRIAELEAELSVAKLSIKNLTHANQEMQSWLDWRISVNVGKAANGVNRQDDEEW